MITGLTSQWVFSIITGTVVWYLTFGTFVWPHPRCWCAGHWKSCFICHGRGHRIRYSRQAINALIRKATER